MVNLREHYNEQEMAAKNHSGDFEDPLGSGEEMRRTGSGRDQDMP